MMPLQRACVAESQVRNKLSNGPLRVQSNVFSQSILQRLMSVNYLGYDSTLKEHSFTMNSRWHRGFYNSSLTVNLILSRAFLFP